MTARKSGDGKKPNAKKPAAAKERTRRGEVAPSIPDAVVPEKSKSDLPRRTLVVVSDLHAHTWAAFARGSGSSNSRLASTLACVRHTLEYARAAAAIWICPGDFVHTIGHTHNVVLNGLLDVLRGFPDVPKLAVWGNHDGRSAGGRIVLAETVLPALLASVENLHVLDSKTWVSPEGITFFGSGYQPRAAMLDLGHGGDVGIFHQTVEGCTTPYGFRFDEGVDSAVLMGLYRTALVGHVHHPQAYIGEDEEEGGRLLLIPGSPEHHHFGDIGEHGFWTIELEQRNGTWWAAEHTLHPNVASPRFLSVESPAEIQEDGNFYRVIGTLPADADLPENATVVAAPPTVVANRALLHEGTDAEHVLHVWTRENPPGEGTAAEYIEAGRDLLAGSEPVHLRDFRLTRVEATNFGSYAGFELDVTDGVTLVTGRSCDFVSNGAGKTTIFEAIYWALTGATTKGLSADDVVRRGERNAEVKLLLQNPQHDVQVIRARRNGTPELSVTIDGVEMSAESVDALTAALLRRLGISREIFKSLAYFSQEDVLLFSRATDAARKEIVRDIVGAGGYQSAATLAGQRAVAAVQEAAKCGVRQEQARAAADRAAADLETERERAEMWAQQRTSRLEQAGVEADAAARKLAEYRVVFGDFVARLLEAVETRRVAFAERVRAGLPSVVEECAREGAARLALDIEGQQRHLSAIVALLTGEYGSVAAAVQMIELAEVLRDQVQATEAEITALRQEYRQADARLAQIDAEIKQPVGALQKAEAHVAMLVDHLAKMEGGVCPTCGKPASADEITRMTAATRAELAQTQQTIDGLRPGIDAREREKEAIRTRQAEIVARGKTLNGELDENLRPALTRLENLARTVQQHADAQTRLESLHRMLADVRGQAEPRAREMVERQVQANDARAARHKQFWTHKLQTETTRLESLVTASRAAVERIGTEVNPYERACAVHEANIRQYQDQATQAAADAGEFQRAERIFRYWEKGFGKQGIQSLLMEEIAAAFNETRSRVFPLLTRGVYDVQFSATSTVRSGELREKTEFVVWYRGEPVPYASLSGGQRKRVDLGVMLTLVLAVAQRQRVPGVLGLIIFDEVFDHLDDDGSECLYTVLEQEVTRTVPAVYAITHDAHLQSLFPRVLRVEQDEAGVSQLFV